MIQSREELSAFQVSFKKFQEKSMIQNFGSMSEGQVEIGYLHTNMTVCYLFTKHNNGASLS